MFTAADKKAITVAKGSLIALYNKRMSNLNDPQLTSLFYDNCIISGGCISSILLGAKVNDIDLYAKTRASIGGISAHIQTKSSENIKLSGDNYEGLSTLPAQPLVTPNAITLKGDVQFIMLGAEDDMVRNNFDFLHCMPYYDIKKNALYISETQFAAIRQQQLVPTLPLDKIKPRRVSKYEQRGWKIDTDIRKKIFEQVMNLTSASSVI